MINHREIVRHLKQYEPRTHSFFFIISSSDISDLFVFIAILRFLSCIFDKISNFKNWFLYLRNGMSLYFPPKCHPFFTSFLFIYSCLQNYIFIFFLFREMQREMWSSILFVNRWIYWRKTILVWDLWTILNKEWVTILL